MTTAELAPISKLPYELLSKIFVMANEEEEEPECHDEPWDDGDPYWRALLRVLPVMVSHVNRHFREVALTTGELWTNVHVGTRNNGPLRYQSLFMERARGWPLNVTAHFGNTEDFRETQPRLVADVITSLQPSAKWRSFTFTVDGYVSIHAGLLQCCKPALQLRCLKIINSTSTPPLFGERFRWPDLVIPIDVFGGVAPSLSSLGLQGVHLPWRSPMLSGLTELELMFHARDVRPTNEEYLKILLNSPGLRRLVLIASGPRLFPFDHPSPIVPLTALEVLEIGALPPAIITYILTSMFAPALNAISLDTWEHSDYTQPLSLVNESRYPALTKLKVVRVTFPTDFLTFVHGLPNLKQLEIYAYDDLLNLLIKSDRDLAHSGSPVLPNLRCLRAAGFKGQQVIEFLARREDLGFGLDKMMMNRWERPDVGTIHVIRSLVKFGFFRGGERDEEPFIEQRDNPFGDSDWEF